MKAPLPSDAPRTPSNAEGRRLPKAAKGSRRALLSVLENQIQTEQRLRQSEALLNEAQALAKVGGWEYDVASDRMHWTDEVFRIYEISRDYDPGRVQQDIELFPAGERVRLAGAFQRAVEQGEPYDLKLQYVTASGRRLWIRTIGRPERKEGKVIRVFGNIIDITERHRAEEAQARLATIVENSYDAIIGRALDGTVSSWNAAAERILGYTAAEAIGRSMIEIQPPETHQVINERLKLLLAGQPVANYETTRITKDGRRIDVAVSGAPIKDDSGNIIGTAAFLRDITERKRAEQQLRDYAKRLRGLSRRLVDIEELERRKINRELHDRIGQNLAALNINLNIIRSGLSQQSLRAVDARFRKTQTLLEETAIHARNVMADLHPPALDDYGLLAALRCYVEAFGARVIVPITVHGEDLAPRLPIAAEMALFRVAQGAIANVVQHARAKHMEVLLAATAERVTLTIADDGAGFDPQHLDPARPSWGLTIMHERAAAVGARLTVESTPGKGTRVCVEIDRLTGSKPVMNAAEYE